MEHTPWLKLQEADQLLCWKNMLVGHTLAAQALREADPSNVVGLASCGGMFASPKSFHGFPHQHLLDPLCLEDNTGKPDFIGLNIYNGDAVRMGETGPERLPYPMGWPRTAFGWPVIPEVMEWGPRFIWERYHLPVYISENGLSCRDWVALDGKVRDPGRIDFLCEGSFWQRTCP